MKRTCLLAADCPEPGWVATESHPACPSCMAAIADDIASLPLDYTNLAGLLAENPAGQEESVWRPKPESRPPINLRINTLMHRIAVATDTWECELRQARRLPMSSRNVRAGFLVARGAQYLAARLPHLLLLPPCVIYPPGSPDPVIRDGIDAALGLRHLHAIAVATLGVTQAVIALPGACPGCNRLTLRRLDGGDDVWCEQCKRSWPYPEYQRYVALMTAVAPPMGQRQELGP